MSPRTDEQFAAIRRKSRQAILDAALELFAREGYSGTSMSRIAGRVGISKGLIYNYFTGKEQILECILDEFVEKIMPAAATTTGPHDPAHYLERIIRNWFEVVRNHPGLVSLGARIHTDPALRRLFVRKQKEAETSTIPRLARVMRKLGSREPEVDMTLLGAALDGIALNYTVSPEDFPIDRVERRLIRQYCTRKGRRT